MSYDTTWRSIDRIADTASLSIRNQAGHSLKSSLNHVFVRDRRDDFLLPSNGYYVRCSQELAGVFGIGNAKFFKTDLQAQYCHQVGGGQLLKDKETGELLGWHPGLVFSLSLRAGWMATYGEHAVTVSDKFMLGGPSSIRGFKTSGIGPRDYRDALGGDAFWAIGLSAIAPIPRWESKPLRLHAFINTGTLVPWNMGKYDKEALFGKWY